MDHRPKRKCKTIKLLEYNIVDNIDELEFDNEFSDTILLCKDTVKRMKRPATEWKKILLMHISEKVLVSKIYMNT